MLNFEIKNRFSGSVLFTASIECGPDASFRVRLGLAVKAAVREGADLQGADLQGAYLRGAYLRGAYLWGADLRGADLQGAYLRGAYLRGAYLWGAYLQGADLRGADLRGAYLQGADLRGADLQGAYLQGAYLRGAYLQGADLRGAYLRGDLKVSKLLAVSERLSDGYLFFLWHLQDGTSRVVAGCRCFTVAEYRAHIAAEYPGTVKASETSRILDFFEASLPATSGLAT